MMMLLLYAMKEAGLSLPVCYDDKNNFLYSNFLKFSESFGGENLQSCKRTAKIGYIIHNVYTSIAKRKEGTGI